MNLAARLRMICDLLPPRGAVIFSREDLLQWLDGEGGPADPCALDDLTLGEAAVLVHRSPSTVRNWLSRGEIPEAYRLNRRDWRIPRLALRRFLDAQANGQPQKREIRGRAAGADLGAWRGEMSDDAGSR